MLIWTGAAGDVEPGRVLDLDRRREASGKVAGKIRRIFSGGFRGAVRGGGQLQQADRRQAPEKSTGGRPQVERQMVGPAANGAASLLASGTAPGRR